MELAATVLVWVFVTLLAGFGLLGMYAVYLAILEEHDKYH